MQDRDTEFDKFWRLVLPQFCGSTNHFYTFYWKTCLNARELSRTHWLLREWKWKTSHQMALNCWLSLNVRNDHKFVRNLVLSSQFFNSLMIEQGGRQWLCVKSWNQLSQVNQHKYNCQVKWSHYNIQVISSQFMSGQRYRTFSLVKN